MGQTTDSGGLEARWRNWLLPLSLLLVSLLLALGGEEATRLLRYQRDAVMAGEWWRLLSGHLVHLGWSHLGLNLAALLLVWLLVGRALTMRQWTALFAFGCVGISLGLLWWLPGLGWYVGLSGVLHTMVVAGSLLLLLKGDREALVVLLIVTVKVFYEMWQGPLPGSCEAAGGEVIYQAHALGYGCAALFIAAQLFIARLRE